jgi:type IV secretory pathway VirB10-like protein
MSSGPQQGTSGRTRFRLPLRFATIVGAAIALLAIGTSLGYGLNRPAQSAEQSPVSQAVAPGGARDELITALEQLPEVQAEEPAAAAQPEVPVGRAAAPAVVAQPEAPAVVAQPEAPAVVAQPEAPAVQDDSQVAAPAQLPSTGGDEPGLAHLLAGLGLLAVGVTVRSLARASPGARGASETR